MTAIRHPLALAAGVLAVLSPAASATDGNLYLAGASIWATGSPFSATVLGGPVWQIGAPATLVPGGSKWEMNWGCPVAGSEIASVHWAALRNAAASHLEQQVAVNGTPVWAEADAGIPQSPAGGRAYAIGLPGGACNVHLRLWQTETRQQHARTYWIDNPRVLVRDLTAPSVVVRAVTGGWIRQGQNAIEVHWSAGDNFGSDGIGWQRVSVAGIEKWAGAPGQGDHGVAIDLSGVTDGAHTAWVHVDGDGTLPAGAGGTVYVDRTPPAAWGMNVAYPGAPGRADLAWTSGDNLSGAIAAEAQLNAATDGSVGPSWVAVAGTAGGAASFASAPVHRVPDGVHAWRVQTTDAAGNTGISPAASQVVVDTTPPTVALAPVSDAWTGHLPLDVTIGDNLQGPLGLGTTDVEVNLNADGSALGAWRTLATGPWAPGRHQQRIALTGLSDGPHQVRVRTRNGGPFQHTLVTERTAVVNVDLTSPTLSGATFTPQGNDAVRVDWVAQDAASGVASARVDWLDRGQWKTLAAGAAANGAASLLVSTASLPEGTVQLRLVVIDGAGNSSEASAPLGSAGVDRTAPAISELRLEGGPPWTVVWRQEDAAMGECAGTIAVRGAATEDWRELVRTAPQSGPMRVLLPVDGLAPGTYRVRVTACDRAGNTASAETAGLAIAGPDGAVPPAIVISAAELGGLGSPGADAARPDALARYRHARLTLRVRGARIERFGGRPFWVSALRYGQSIQVDGRLLSQAGRPMQRIEIVARGYKDRLLTRTATRRDGRFRMTVRPDAGGIIRVGVPAGAEVLPARANAGIRVRMLPRVSFRASTRSALAFGAPVAFTGRVSPSPALLGGSPRKAVILEWLDPLRRVWRPVLNSRVRRDGTFRFVWRFQARGLTIPMRVRVPVERGWPLAGALSQTVRVRVR